MNTFLLFGAPADARPRTVGSLRQSVDPYSLPDKENSSEKSDLPRADSILRVDKVEKCAVFFLELALQEHNFFQNIYKLAKYLQAHHFSRAKKSE